MSRTLADVALGIDMLELQRSCQELGSCLRSRQSCKKRRTRYDIYMYTNASYYGYRDEEDGVLARVEGPTEVKMRAEANEELRRMEEIRREAKEVVSVGVLRERFCLRTRRM
ncbi:hypothetical protein PVK06_003045 [Gossypium arboreum]|uniref:Uncharacterized protein n=1 Tax=Gossypium arboreum TaxID=29729 RepID=A0ABR0R545_GOSAR|nr:hypothetical protein PVK06_003045 [Gossypium arboreum]